MSLLLKDDDRDNPDLRGEGSPILLKDDDLNSGEVLSSERTLSLVKPLLFSPSDDVVDLKSLVETSSLRLLSLSPLKDWPKFCVTSAMISVTRVACRFSG